MEGGEKRKRKGSEKDGRRRPPNANSRICPWYIIGASPLTRRKNRVDKLGKRHRSQQWQRAGSKLKTPKNFENLTQNAASLLGT